MSEFIWGDVYRDRIQLETPGSNGCRRHGSRPHGRSNPPYCTITANLRQGKAGLQSDKYQDIITLDCDDMPAVKRSLWEFRHRWTNILTSLVVLPCLNGWSGWRLRLLISNEAEALRTELNVLGTVDLPLPSNAIITTVRSPQVAIIWKAAQYQSRHYRQRERSGTRDSSWPHDPDAFLPNDWKREAADRKSDIAHWRRM